MARRFASLRARAICHATEDPAKVEQALRCVVGDAEVAVSTAEGHYGNPILTMEAAVGDEGDIISVLSRLRRDDLMEVLNTLESRMDESCHLHVRADKAAAYSGSLELAGEGDVVSLRLKVRAFPAKPEAALKVVRELIHEIAGQTP